MMFAILVLPKNDYLQAFRHLDMKAKKWAKTMSAIRILTLHALCIELGISPLSYTYNNPTPICGPIQHEPVNKKVHTPENAVTVGVTPNPGQRVKDRLFQIVTGVCFARVYIQDIRGVPTVAHLCCLEQLCSFRPLGVQYNPILYNTRHHRKIILLCLKTLT